MDKLIKKGLEKIRGLTKREEKHLVKEDVKRDKKCDKAMKMKKAKKK